MNLSQILTSNELLLDLDLRRQFDQHARSVSREMGFETLADEVAEEALLHLTNYLDFKGDISRGLALEFIESDIARQKAYFDFRERSMISRLTEALLSPRKRHVDRATQQARALVEFATALLPKKVADEQIGDLLEQLTDFAKENTHPWRIQAQALSGVSWAFLYTLRDFVKSGAIAAAVWKFLS